MKIKKNEGISLELFQDRLKEPCMGNLPCSAIRKN